MRAKIGYYAVATTTAVAVKRYQLTYRTLSKQTIHGFKKAYLKEKEATNKEVTVMTSKTRGQPKLLSEDIMAKTIQTVEAVRLNAAQVSSAVINAIVKGVAMAENRCLVLKYEGHLCFSYHWARNLERDNVD